jgi:sec-independent protein translocase protein TatC
MTSPLHKKMPLQRHEIKIERILNTENQTILYAIPSPPLRVSEGVVKQENGSYLIQPGGYLDLEKMVPQQNLYLLSPLEGISTVFRICFWAGLILSAPAWGYTLLQFIAPALNRREQNYLFPFIGLSILFIALGAIFAYMVTIPAANSYLLLFNANLGLNLWTLSNYLDYTFLLLIGNGIAFEIGLILLFLVHLGVVSAEFLASKRRHFIVIAFILAALLTPPEVMSQILLAIPLIGLFEASIFYAKLRGYFKNSLE